MSDERTELLSMLADQRNSLLITVRGLTDADAVKRTTVSELTLGALIKHVTNCERNWIRIMLSPEQVSGTEIMDPDEYKVPEGVSLAELVDRYKATAAATDRAVREFGDLGTERRLPDWPWLPEAEPVYWSARRILLHLLRETAHHCGHADIIRESLDGANTTAQWA